MRPLVLGRSPWQTEAIARDVFVHGGWQWEAMTGAFAFAGIDMALWDLCGKAAGQPLSHLFGGPVRETVEYFYYLAWGDPDSLRAQCAEGLARGHSVFYFKAGADFDAELAMLKVVRDALGSGPRLRVDPNQAWPFADALRNVAQMHAAVGLDFVEAPTKGGRHANWRELARMTGVPVGMLQMQKMIVNEAVERMGLLASQTLATVFDGITRHNPEGLWFRRHAQVHGFKDAVAWRVSGRPIPQGDEARALIADAEKISKGASR